MVKKAKVYEIYGYYKPLGKRKAKHLGLYATKREAVAKAKWFRKEGYVVRVRQA